MITQPRPQGFSDEVDDNKVSSLSNTTVVSVFPNLCLWRRSLRSNMGGIDLEKLYRATLKRQYKGCLLASLAFVFSR